MSLETSTKKSKKKRQKRQNVNKNVKNSLDMRCNVLQLCTRTLSRLMITTNIKTYALRNRTCPLYPA